MSYDWFLGDFLARKMVLVKKTAVDRNTFLSADGDVIKEVGKRICRDCLLWMPDRTFHSRY